MLQPLLLAQAGASPDFLRTAPLFVAIGLVWWFVLLKPQRDQEKKHRAMLEALTVGQKVITSGGIHGTLAQVSEKTVMLKIADNVKIKVSRSAIAGPEAEDAPADRPRES